MSREKRQENSFREQHLNTGSKTKVSAERNNRRHRRFEIDEASALMYTKGFLSAVGLRRSSKGLGVMNLSEGGVLLVSDRKLQKGKKVRVRIEMAKYRDSFESDGVVRWVVTSQREGRGFYVGVEFASLDDASVRRLKQMRNWFTSPEFQAKNAARKRERMTEFRFRK